ncbi:MAG: hypothetical protein M0P72_13535 [Metallibacterium scheffleri]|jgi:hypothetical protein|uniref:hypothetical protein n=1 Tax=Metallibacterium scheffleri TaxID=993689 RepID=UPI0026F1B002|nr:hypothetical protein [Metallibacterium scheffleri]MCK9368149.1 hypothetical protein [Metallibacterium scheffleri]
MRPRHIVSLLACVLLPLLAACSKPAADTGNAANAGRVAHAGSAAQTDAGLANTPLGPMLKDEQRARDVQTIVNRQAAKQRAQIAAQTH